MRLRARLLRILRVTTIAVLSLILLAFAFVQSNQYLLRYRAKHLLADFHSLRLNQSTWQDAQRLITRWGAFGQYDGTCTARDCDYVITVGDVGSRINLRLYKYMEARSPQSYSGITLGRVLQLLGSRGGSMRMGFLVQDGIVKRSYIGLAVEVRIEGFWCDMNCGYGLMLSAQANQSLPPPTGDGPWIMGDQEQLAQHPNYKAGRPSGCEGCISEEVTFTPYLSQSDINTLTSYNISCLTRHFHQCRIPSDVLAIAGNWRLYPIAEGVADPPRPSGPPRPCDIPVYALGRDATDVLELKVLSVKTQKEPAEDMYPSGRDIETAKVQVVAKLKGARNWPFNTTVDAIPYSWDVNFPREAGEHLEPGKTFIVTPDSEYSTQTHLSMKRCGVLPDSPEVRAELQKGFAQNDQLLHEEKSGSILW